MNKNKKKIGFYVSSLSMGGAERVTIYLTEYFNRKNINAMIITNSTANHEYNLDHKIKRVSLSEQNSKESSLIIISKLKKIIKQEKLDALIIMGTPLLVYAVPALFGKKIKLIVSERNSPENFSGKKITKFLSNVLISKADGFIFQTKGASEYYSWIEDKDKTIISNPLFIKDLPKPYEGERARKIVSVGRLHKQKNQEMLIKSFAKLANKFPSYQLVIYGEGPEREHLENLIKQLKLSERVSLPGSHPDVLEEIKTASLFAFSSNFEGMPNALIEAMALGLPVVSTDCPSGGPRELIKHGHNGLLSPVGDEVRFTENLEYLLKNREIAEKLGQEAIEIRKKLNAEKIGQEWLEFSLKFIS